jgi:putative membrane protein
MLGKLLLGTVVITSLVALSACEQRDTTVTSNDNDRVTVAPAGPATAPAPATNTQTITSNGKAALDSETRDYVQKAAMGDMLEVESSRLALNRSATPEIKQFAQQMVDAHTMTSDELKARLARAGLIVELPAMLDDEHKKMVDDLRSASARDFDSNYLQLQKNGHEEALDVHRDYAMNGTVADLKAFAADTVPKVEMHVGMVADLQNRMNTRVSKR